MVKGFYEAPDAKVYEIAVEKGIALSMFGVEGAAGEDLKVDNVDLNW